MNESTHRSALLVIDVQQSFLHRPYFSATGLAAYLEQQNRLIEGAQRLGLPIVRVLHEEEGGPEQPFSPASGLVRPMEGLMGFEATHTVHKTRHSALVGTGLDVWLTQRGLNRLLISGIRTEQCCETTTRHASDLGWHVAFVPEATMTWDIALPDGSVYPAHEIQRRTTAVLNRRFADVVDVAKALQDACND